MRSTVTLGDRIRGLTRERRQTQDDIAAVLDIHRSTLRRKLDGKTDFTASEMLRLSHHFDITLDELYGEPAALAVAGGAR